VALAGTDWGAFWPRGGREKSLLVKNAVDRVSRGSWEEGGEVSAKEKKTTLGGGEREESRKKKRGKTIHENTKKNMERQ